MGNEGIVSLSNATAGTQVDLSSQQAETSTQLHVLEPGQSPQEVAEQYGVTEHALRQTNGLGPGQAVYPGTRLVIPPRLSDQTDGGASAQPVDFRTVPAEDGTSHTPAPPDFGSMSQSQIQAFLKSPEFAKMAAQERQMIANLYNAGRKEEAASYLANALNGLPPEVAARLAAECKPLLEQMSRDAGRDEKVFAQLGRAMNALAATDEGRELVKQVIERALVDMPPEEITQLLRSISSGSTENAASKLAWLTGIQEKYSGKLPPFHLADELMKASENAAHLVQSIIAAYSRAHEQTEKLDQEFAALLARMGRGLTPAQTQALYREFMADPKHKAAYEAAANAARQMAEIASLAPTEFARLARSVKGAETVQNLIKDLARDGHGTAALALVLAIKNDPTAAAGMARVADMAKLERLAGAAAIAEATVKAGGDTRKGLEALARQFDTLKGVVEQIMALLDDVSGNDTTSPEALRHLLAGSGIAINVVGGILAMVSAFQASDGKDFDARMIALGELGLTVPDTASDVLTILSGIWKEDTAFGSKLKVAEGALQVLGKVVAVVAGAKSVTESILYMVDQGEVNAGDIVSIVGVVIGVAGTFAPAAMAGPLGLLALLVGIAGLALKSNYEEQKLVEQIVEYLIAGGMTRELAERLARNPDALRILGEAGFSPEQIQDLAIRYRWIFGNEGTVQGVAGLAKALAAGGYGPERTIALFDSLPAEELSRFLQTVGMEQDAKMRLHAANDRGSLIEALEYIARQRNLPGTVHETARRILDWISRQ